MFTHDLPAAQRREADGAGAARAAMAIAPAFNARFFHGGATPGGDGTAQGDCGAGWRIHLLPVVHLDNLGIILRAGQGGGHAFSDGEEQIDAGREIRGIDNRRALAGFSHCCFGCR